MYVHRAITNVTPVLRTATATYSLEQHVLANVARVPSATFAITCIKQSRHILETYKDVIYTKDVTRDI